MAPKDYVKRSQAKKPAQKRKAPAARNTRSKRGAKSVSVPWIKVCTALAVVGLFVFGLYRLQSVDSEQNRPVAGSPTLNTNEEGVLEQATDRLEIVKPTRPLELEMLPPLPVLGEEEWEYIDSLPDYSVEVDATGPKQSDKDFIMQCGSFRTQERAEALRAKIAFQGLESRILTSTGRNGLWYRVVLGPYDRKREAEGQRHQLRNGSVNGCKIW